MRRSLAVILVALLGSFAPLTGCDDGNGGQTGQTEPEPDPQPTPDPNPDTPTPDPTPDPQPDGDPDPNPEPIVDGEIVVPLGETLFMDGDDYLSFWGVDHPDPVEIVSSPEGATALLTEGVRLTPDVVGEWVLKRGEDTRTVTVRSNFLNEDTFINYNYSPSQPIVKISETEIWVASPPSNAVHRVVISEAGPEPAELVPTGSWPTAAVHWEDEGVLLVSQAGRDSLGFLDLAEKRLVDAIEVGDEPAGIVLHADAPGGPVAYVALSGSNEIAKVDLTARAVVARVDVGRDPRALAFDGQRLFAASLLSSNSTPQGLQQGQPVPIEDQRDVAVIDVASFEVVDWVHSVGTILRGLWLDPENPEVLVVARSHSNNDKSGIEADSNPHSHGLTLVDIREGSPSLYETVGEVDLDDQPSSSGPAASPFTMMMLPSGETLAVTLSAGKGVLLLDSETFEQTGRVGTGHDPRGLVMASGRLWTYAWLSNSLHGIGLVDDRPVLGGGVEVEVGDDPTPLDVKAGQQIFSDANFSKNNDFSCNNCHIDGLTDGLVWNILLDGDVNTLAFRNIGGTAPFLWGGFLPTLFDFSREVLRLVGATASGKQMDRLTTYMQSVTAPPNPFALPGGRLTEAGKRGQALFFGSVAEGGAGCGDCHSGALFTNTTVVDGKTEGTQTDVPSLISTYDTGPWGRLAQWTTLDDMVAYGLEYTGADLEQSDIEDINAYVRQLPGDLLYLNSAIPLNNSRRVFNMTPVELTFSSILAEGQESAFELLFEDSGEWRQVQGVWQTSGRKARFVPTGPLGQETSYVINVKAGLRGALGRVASDPLTLTFETGATPQTDVSGRWRWNINGPVSGNVIVAVIQAEGGHFSGTILESSESIDFDHLEGYVSGMGLFSDPFLVETPFGQVQVESVEIDMVDEDNDGYADSGTGVLRSIINLNVELVREAYPDDREAP